MERDGGSLLYFRADPDVPITYWENMSVKEKQEFLQLRDQFHQNQKASMKDRRLVSFGNEMQMVLKYTEKSDTFRENKCILIGIAFAGPFICVNTRQLKTFLGRCKSSINGSFQQLGYVALRTKSKARNCVLSVLPSLSNEPNLLRQWSVRYASDDAKYCYISRFMPSQLPTITPEDLFEERKQNSALPQRQMTTATSMQNIAQFSRMNTAVAHQIPRVPSVPVQKSILPPPISKQSKKMIEFDLPEVSELGFYDDTPDMPELSTSFTLDCFNDVDLLDSNTNIEWDSKLSEFLQVPRSRSAYFEDMTDLAQL